MENGLKSGDAVAFPGGVGLFKGMMTIGQGLHAEVVTEAGHKVMVPVARLAKSALAGDAHEALVKSVLDAEERNKLKESEYAIPATKDHPAKEPLEDAAHVRDAAARLGQVKGVSAKEKVEARRRIARAEGRDHIDGEDDDLKKDEGGDDIVSNGAGN